MSFFKQLTNFTWRHFPDNNRKCLPWWFLGRNQSDMCIKHLFSPNRMAAIFHSNQPQKKRCGMADTQYKPKNPSTDLREIPPEPYLWDAISTSHSLKWCPLRKGTRIPVLRGRFAMASSFTVPFSKVLKERGGRDLWTFHHWLRVFMKGNIRERKWECSFESTLYSRRDG